MLPFLTCAAIALGAAPSAVIDGPSSGFVGDPVKLTAAKSVNATDFVWSVLWIDPDSGRPLPATGLSTLKDDGSEVLFTNRRAGHYLFLLSVGSGGKGVDHTMHEVDLAHEAAVVKSLRKKRRQVEEEDDDGEDEDGEEDRPAKRPKDAAAAAKEWATTEVKSKNLRAEAIILGGTFISGANLIATTNIRTADQLMEYTQKNAQAALGASYPAWAPWFANLRDSISALSEQGALTTMASYQALWNRLGMGLQSL